MELNRNQRFGIVSTIIFIGGFVILLLVLGFTTPFPPPGEEGILINFGTSEVGSGEIEPAPSEQPIEQQAVSEPVTSEPEPIENNGEDVITQNFDNTAVIEQKRKDEQRKKEEIEEKKRRDEEIERKKQEEIEIQRKAEEDRKKQESIQKANDRAKNAFGGKNPNGGNTGEGDGGGEGNQGDPNGDINTKNRVGTPGGNGGGGVEFSLAGRSSRSLPEPPKIHKTEGKIVVEVTVDQNGNVVSARAGVKGSTLSDAALLNVTREFALKATFDVNKNAPALQQGTITYFFDFN